MGITVVSGYVLVEVVGEVRDPGGELGGLLRQSATNTQIDRDAVLDAVLGEAVAEEVVVVLAGVEDETGEALVDAPP